MREQKKRIKFLQNLFTLKSIYSIILKFYYNVIIAILLNDFQPFI